MRQRVNHRLSRYQSRGTRRKSVKTRYPLPGGYNFEGFKVSSILQSRAASQNTRFPILKAIFLWIERSTLRWSFFKVQDNIQNRQSVMIFAEAHGYAISN